MKNQQHKKITTIRVSEKLKNTLKELGKKGDTYEDIIWRLLEKNE